MTKPTLLLNPGMGWAATTPFHFTLTLQNKYAHHGKWKENWYLKRLSEYPKYEDHFYTINDPATQRKTNRPFDTEWGEYLSGRNKYAGKYEENPLKFLFDRPPSIENYISYYLGQWEAVKGEYAAVCDFTNGNAELSYQFLSEIAPKLKEKFDVKVTFQFRDPVRRYFSEVGSLFSKKFEFSVDHKEDAMTKLLLRKKNAHKKLFFHLLRQGRCSSLCDFAETWYKYSSIFGKENTYVIIMEDFWDKNKEKEQLNALSNFLSYKITKLHENCYVPDMGSRAPHYENLHDQWQSDLEDLTEGDYQSALIYMSRYYTDFYNMFSFLPESWKK